VEWRIFLGDVGVSNICECGKPRSVRRPDALIVALPFLRSLHDTLAPHRNPSYHVSAFSTREAADGPTRPKRVLHHIDPLTAQAGDSFELYRRPPSACAPVHTTPHLPPQRHSHRDDPRPPRPCITSPRTPGRLGLELPPQFLLCSYLAVPL
jgi:hypothetical protein